MCVSPPLHAPPPAPPTLPPSPPRTHRPPAAGSGPLTHAYHAPFFPSNSNSPGGLLHSTSFPGSASAANVHPPTLRAVAFSPPPSNNAALYPNILRAPALPRISHTQHVTDDLFAGVFGPAQPSSGAPTVGAGAAYADVYGPLTFDWPH